MLYMNFTVLGRHVSIHVGDCSLQNDNTVKKIKKRKKKKAKEKKKMNK